jgi:hypothetical protein
VDVQRGAIHALGLEEAPDEAAVSVVADRRDDPDPDAKSRQPGGDVAGEPAHEALERPDLLERRAELLRIEIRADAAEHVRVDAHGTTSRASSHARSHASAIASARRPSSALTRGGVR